MKKSTSDAKTILNRLGQMSGFLKDLKADAGKDASFDFPLEIIQRTMNFDISVLYKISNVIENRLILEVVKKLDPQGLRMDLKEGRKIRIFLDNRDRKFLNEVNAFLNRKVSHVNVPGMGCDIMGYVYLPENFGGAYLFGGDFYGKESSIKDYEVAGVEVMCNFLSAILLKTQFEQQADYDDLTGLFNSAKIRRKVKILLKRFERKTEGATASLVLGDIDFFKSVNDTHGHIQGDAVLKTIGAILSGSLREGFDLAGRYGGEEFLLILDETDSDTALKIVERLRETIEQTDIQMAQTQTEKDENKSIRVTMSFGIAEFDKTGIERPEEWISRADKALYASKNNGRNQTSVFKEKNQ